MNRDRAYPISLVAMLFIAAAIATAIVGHTQSGGEGTDAAPVTASSS